MNIHKLTGPRALAAFVALSISAPTVAAPSFAAPVPVFSFDALGAGAGRPVAIAGDTLVTGGFLLSGAGVVYVYQLTSGVWVQTARLTSSDTPASVTGVAIVPFGMSLAVSPDGNTVFIGNPMVACAADQNLPCGAIDIYRKPAAGWVDTSAPDARLTSTETGSEELGTSLGISGDGSTLVAYGDTAYVFDQPVSGWVSGTQTAVLGPQSGGNTNGSFSAVSVDGGVVATNTTGQSVLVYVEPVAGWQDTTTATATLTYSGHFDDEEGDFGRGLTVNGGNVILVGAPNIDSALVYQEPASGGWISTSTPTYALPVPALTPNFGTGVAIVGNTAIVSGGDSVYLYDEPAGGWGSGAVTPTSILLGTSSSGGLGGMYATGTELVIENDAGPPGGVASVLSPTAGSSIYDGLLVDSVSIDDTTTEAVRTTSGFNGDLLNFNFDIQSAQGFGTSTATLTFTATGGTLVSSSRVSGASCNPSGATIVCHLTVPASATQSLALQVTEQTDSSSAKATVNASLSAVSPITWAGLGGTLTGSANLTVPPTVPATGSFTNTAGQTITGNLPVTNPAGLTLSYFVVQQPAQGTLSADRNTGVFTWTPPSTSFNGTVQFTYDVSAGAHTTSTCTITLDESGGSGSSNSGSGSGKGGGGGLGVSTLMLLSGLLARRRGWLSRR